MYKLKPIAERIYREIFTNKNLDHMRKYKNVQGGFIDISEYFDILPKNSYIYMILNISQKRKNHCCCFDKIAVGATIELNIWRKNFLQTNRRKMETDIINVLIHEFTHALDHIITNGKADAKYKAQNKIETKEYVLDPMEVNAYIHEIASLKNLYKKVKNYEAFEDIIVVNISALFDARYILSKKDWLEVRKVYLKRMARENILPKCLTKN